MEIIVSHQNGRVPVTVIKVSGQLDGQTYTSLIEKAREIYESGTRNALLDFSGLTYISSAGLVSLHTIALLMRGEAMPDIQKGWSALKTMDKTRNSGAQKHVKLLNLRPEVLRVLELVGFLEFFEVYTDLDAAVQSF